MLPEQRTAVCNEARTWIGTRYHHGANIKGAGVDCAMLLCEVYRTVGIVPLSYDPRPYPQHWFLHRGEERFMGRLFEHAEKTDAPIPGDIVLFRFGRTASHGAILIEDECIVHAYQLASEVTIDPLRTLMHRLDSYWKVR